MSFSDYLENELIGHIFWNTTMVAPSATLYLAVGTASDEVTLTEPSGNGYARVAITSNATNWVDNGNGSVVNASDIDFPTPSGSWGTLTHFGIYDAISGGNLLIISALTGSRTITLGDFLRISAGNLTITIQ